MHINRVPQKMWQIIIIEGNMKIITIIIKDKHSDKENFVPYFATFDASGRIFLFITSSTVNFLFAWYKRLGSDGIFANAT